MGEKELEMLASIIIRKIKEEFSLKHLSGNLVNTITIEKLSNEIKINIPAQTYNMLLYQSKGVVIHTTNGSYASRLDETGSEFFVYPKGTKKGSKLIKPHNHRGYVDRIINSAILEWQGLVEGKTKVEE